MRLRSVQLSLRFIVPLACILALFGYIAVPLMESFTVRWFVRDLDIRSQLLSSALQQPLLDYLESGQGRRIDAMFDRAIQDERLYALGFCASDGRLLYKTVTYPESLGCRHTQAQAGKPSPLVRLPQGPVHVSESTLAQDGQAVGRLILVHDMSFIERRSADTKKYLVGLFAVLACAVSLITVLIAHLSWRGWVNGVREMLRGELLPRSTRSMSPEMAPLASDLRALLRDYHQERQGTSTGAQDWSAESLKTLLRQDLAGDQVLVGRNT